LLTEVHDTMRSKAKQKATKVARRPKRRAAVKATPGVRLLVTIPQAAEMLACSRATIYELVGRGELDLVHLGRASRVTSASIERRVSGAG
jgi:excisionase family DNA binding protein